MAHTQHTHSLAHLEEALTVLFCLIETTPMPCSIPTALDATRQ
jgi:hypothetical protein